VDDGIHFGEVEQASPQVTLRPDRNKHYAVVEYESPKDADLPIFIDLDVLLDMEEHALSDASVELGGVLLGGHYEDDQGRPFVVITDSLRAQHYESTKGSFTFTHDTWSAITREREQFPPELAMVGWYHTHPDWGVFLSGMDMFICDNFFNKKLDVAYVIDPCRGDRGMFQWTGDPRQRVRRTGGFFVTASRFRAAELEHYVAELRGEMPATTRTPAGTHGSPVVHLHQPAPAPPPPWQAPAIAGMLALQFCLLALIAWKMIEPGSLTTSDEDRIAAALEALDERLAEKSDLALREERLAMRAELLDEISGTLKGTPSGSVQDIERKYDRSQELMANVEARDSQIHDLKLDKAVLQDRIGSEKRLRDRTAKELADLQTSYEKLATKKKSLEERLAVLEPKKVPADKEAGDAPAEVSVWWYVGGGVLAALLLVGSIWGWKLWADKEGEATETSDRKPPEGTERIVEP
jgi:proteasome lid subunit RPN8/RPN11